jgi:hypothetical protein
MSEKLEDYRIDWLHHPDRMEKDSISKIFKDRPTPQGRNDVERLRIQQRDKWQL